MSKTRNQRKRERMGMILTVSEIVWALFLIALIIYEVKFV